MKFTLRNVIGAFSLALALSVFGPMRVTATAQDRYGRDRGADMGRMAERMGEEDGYNDGRKDRETGHSNRPTQGDNYKNATRGFSGGDGETAYKEACRRAYVPAYQRGYEEHRDHR